MHGWRPLLVLVGGQCGPEALTADDVLGHLLDEPLKIKDVDRAKRAVAWTQQVLDEVRDRLKRGQPLLAMARTPAKPAVHAVALGEGLEGLADGLDLAGIDPDQLPPEAETPFAYLARVSAEALELADELGEGEEAANGSDERIDELHTWTDQTDRELRRLYEALTATHRPS